MSLTKAEVVEIFRYAWAGATAAKYGDVFTERGERVVADLLPDDRVLGGAARGSQSS